MPQFCSSFSERVPCVFSVANIGQRARPGIGSKCTFCDPAKMQTACRTRNGRKRLISALRAFRAHYEEHSHVYNSALMLVPDERREELHAEALKASPAAQLCPGWAPGLPCIYSQERVGLPAMAHNGGQCLFCSKARMADARSTAKGRANIAKALKSFRAHYAKHTHVYNSAILKVPEELRDEFHEEALKPKRRAPRRPRAPRAAAAERQSEAMAETWRAALTCRKRAFKELSSKEVTAYKKRRTADRARVEKKFFLDNQLPRPEPKDLAENDAGLPPASLGDRAAFVETWCKLGAWGICEKCGSLQPRPLEPLDARRVAPAAITAKACKQCRANHWVPQPGEIPAPLQKLSTKMVQKLRPLEIDVGPLKKANNGYRIKSAMTRLRWCARPVEDKIAKAGAGRSRSAVLLGPVPPQAREAPAGLRLLDERGGRQRLWRAR